MYALFLKDGGFCLHLSYLSKPHAVMTARILAITYDQRVVVKRHWRQCRKCRKVTCS